MMFECKVCKQSITRVKFKKRRNGPAMRWIYVDSKNREWYARMCPDCGIKKRNKRRTEVEKEEDECSFVPPKPKMRPCVICKTPSINYFKCGHCLSRDANDYSADFFARYEAHS